MSPEPITVSLDGCLKTVEDLSLTQLEGALTAANLIIDNWRAAALRPLQAQSVRFERLSK
jgi:hypothetical protein